MKVSIITATYNRAKLLSASIESVLQQTHNNLELIIVDDGSTDETKQIVQSYKDKDERIHYILLEENQGASFSRNYGIKVATGELIMVWDSDDVLYPQAIARVVDKFKADPELAVVSAPCKQLRGDDELSYTHRDSGLVSLNQILCKYIPSNEKVRVARANVYKQVSYQSRNIDFIVSGYLAEQGSWFHFDEELGELRMQQDTVSLTSARKKPSIHLSLQRLPHLVKYLEKFGSNLLKACPSRYAAYAYGTSLGLILNNQKREARQLLRIAIKKYPRLLRCWFVFFLTLLPGTKKILQVFFNLRGKTVS